MGVYKTLDLLVHDFLIGDAFRSFMVSVIPCVNLRLPFLAVCTYELRLGYYQSSFGASEDLDGIFYGAYPRRFAAALHKLTYRLDLQNHPFTSSIPPYKRWWSVAELKCRLQGCTLMG
jgi:hypothetical protein